MVILKQRGQSVTEYAIVFSIVAAAVIGMQIFVKRGLQAKQKDASNYFTAVTGDAALVGGSLNTTKQYEPYYAESDYSVRQARDSDEEVKAGYTVDRTTIAETTTRATGGLTKQGVDLSQDTAWK
jgi:hypothetical protein